MLVNPSCHLNIHGSNRRPMREIIFGRAKVIQNRLLPAKLLILL